MGELAERLAGVPHGLAVRAAREAIAEARERVLAGGEAGDVEQAARERLAVLLEGTLRPVVNATGVIVHTNLGRAPLARAAREAAAESASGYANLEYDVASGERGSRQAHVEPLLTRLTGAEAGMAVNNCAGAVLLACAALAGGREVVVSRGQLVEIGGSFRIPEVAQQSGARLVEVGTTNRTRIADYARGARAADRRRAARAPVELPHARLRGGGRRSRSCARWQPEHGVPVIDDVGSGVLADGIPELADEPRRAALRGRRRRARVLLGRQAARRAAGGAPVRHGGGGGRVPRASARARAADRQALARGAGGHASPLPRPRPRRRGRSRCCGCSARSSPSCRLAPSACGRCWTATASTAQVLRASAKVGGGALPLLELEGPVCAVDPGTARARRAGSPACARASRR